MWEDGVYTVMSDALLNMREYHGGTGGVTIDKDAKPLPNKPLKRKPEDQARLEQCVTNWVKYLRTTTYDDIAQAIEAQVAANPRLDLISKSIIIEILRDLSKKGVIEKTGEKRLTRSDKMSQVYRMAPTKEEREALQQLIAQHTPQAPVDLTSPPLSRARTTDPGTSKIASVKLSLKNGSEQVNTLRWLYRNQDKQWTSREIATEFPDDVLGPNDQMHKRLSDLKRKGLAVMLEQRTCNVSGHVAHVWQITKLGIEYCVEHGL